MVNETKQKEYWIVVNNRGQVEIHQIYETETQAKQVADNLTANYCNGNDAYYCEFYHPKKMILNQK